MIPEGWRSVPLANIAKSKIVYGIVQAGPHDPNGVPYLKSSDIGGRIDRTSLQRTAPEIHRRFGRSTVVPGDIVISLRGNIGDTSVIPHDLAEANLTQGTARISVSEDFDRDFIFFQLSSFDVQRRIHSVTKGSTFVEITLEDLRKIEVPVPESRKKQRYIADLFLDWSRAIETVEALIANARAQKQALMQQLLPQGTTPPKKRLPGFSGEWKEIRLGQAFTERVERGEDGLALLSVTQANGVIPQEDAGRRNISSTDQSKYKTVRAGDIAYNTMRMWQGASALSGLTGKVSPAYTVVTPRNEHDPLFYSYLFKQSKMIHIFERHSQGLVSDTWNLKFPLFAKIRICVPRYKEQLAIASAFKRIDEAASAYEVQLIALREEKAALMQQMLTGKRRVKLSESKVV